MPLQRSTLSPPLRIAILISGTGSNMLAIADACRDGLIHGSVVGVLSDKADARGLATARERGLPVAALPIDPGETRAAHDDRLLAAVRALEPDIVVLAGYMRILSHAFVEALADRLINIHPALLPKHKGLHTHRRVLEAGDTTHGATVHFVTPELDAGPSVLQGRIQVNPGEDEQSLFRRVQRCEHVIYPTVLKWLAEGRLRYVSGKPHIDGHPLELPLVRDFDV